MKLREFQPLLLVKTVVCAISDPALRCLENANRAARAAGAPKVGVVLVGFSAGDTQSALVTLERWRSNYPGPTEAVLVMNGQAKIESTAGWRHVSGSNLAHEFSGFDEGRLALRDFDPDVYIFANERLDAYPWPGITVLSPRLISAVATFGLAVGHVDVLDTPILAGTTGQLSYIRSNLLIAPRSVLAGLERIASYSQVDSGQILPPGWPQNFSSEAVTPLSIAYLHNLQHWLTGVGSSRQSVWHRASNDPSDNSILRAKAISIVNEHLLAVQLQQLGARIIDLTWASRLAFAVGRKSRMNYEVDRLVETYGAGLDSRKARWRLLIIRFLKMNERSLARI